jgi:hypothetical protein
MGRELSWRWWLVVGTAISGAACTQHAPPAAQRTTTTRPQHLCVGGKGAPPPEALTYVVVGHPGNEWHELVGSDGVTLQVRITQPPNTEVTKAGFFITAEGAPSDRVVRQLAVREKWFPGTHTVSFHWDARDESGRKAPAGSYRLSGEVMVSEARAVMCADGSGRGTEKTRASETYGLGILSVR